VGFPCERETEASRSQFGPEQRSTSSWSVSFAAIHGPRATDIWRRCDLQLRVKARQDKRNLSFSLGSIGWHDLQFYSDQSSFISAKEDKFSIRCVISQFKYATEI